MDGTEHLDDKSVASHRVKDARLPVKLHKHDRGKADECADVRLTFCGVGETPVDASPAAETLIGQALSEPAIEDVVASVQAMIAPAGSVHATADYQRHVAAVLAERALRTADRRARDGG